LYHFFVCHHVLLLVLYPPRHCRWCCLPAAAWGELPRTPLLAKLLCAFPTQNSAGTGSTQRVELPQVACGVLSPSFHRALLCLFDCLRPTT
jgi:hypothetical protein